MFRIGPAYPPGLVAENIVFWLVLFAWAGLDASIWPTSIMAPYWKKTTKAGVIVGLLTKTFVTIIWYFVPVLKDSMYELIPGFFPWPVCYLNRQHIHPNTGEDRRAF
ncbi:MAG: hypothetical protein MK198_08430 [Gracilimonas sp.]|uniref:sodium:solute symporter family transporter n=1 Tax=Gracilimonas sp. TaxID=1974203 RepID=UPI003752C409|nr:hypothetical protein [Gracilimonas sp.]